MDDIEQIKDLKARYFLTMDGKDWPAMREVFTEDAAVDISGAGGAVYDTPEAFIAYLSKTLGSVQSLHEGSQPEIQLTSPDTAIGTWILNDCITLPNGSEFRGFGKYDETYAKVDGEWLITSSILVRQPNP